MEVAIIICLRFLFSLPIKTQYYYSYIKFIAYGPMGQYMFGLKQFLHCSEPAELEKEWLQVARGQKILQLIQACGSQYTKWFLTWSVGYFCFHLSFMFQQDKASLNPSADEFDGVRNHTMKLFLSSWFSLSS